MAVDILSRASSMMAFVEEALVEGRGPGQGITLSAEALDGLAIIAREVKQAVREAGEMV